ncbi:hypothetical protein [Nitrospira sp. Nam80]
METVARSGFRVDFRPVTAPGWSESTGRVHELTEKECRIVSPTRCDPGTELELRLYIPDTSWPLCVTRASVTWKHWDTFNVQFETLPETDQTILQRMFAGHR